MPLPGEPPLHAASAMIRIQGFTRAAYRVMLSAMPRRLLLAVVISCACTTRSRSPSVEHTTDAERPRAPTNALGLADGVTWEWTGTRTDDAGDHEVRLRTKVTRVEHGDRATTYEVTGWPGIDPESSRRTTIVIEDGVASVDGEPWIRVEPAAEELWCPEGEYCWSVEPGDPTGHDIYFRTGPDVTVYHLEPGRGVTGFLYHHNGTTDDLQLHRK